MTKKKPEPVQPKREPKRRCPFCNDLFIRGYLATHIKQSHFPRFCTACGKIQESHESAGTSPDFYKPCDGAVFVWDYDYRPCEDAGSGHGYTEITREMKEMMARRQAVTVMGRRVFITGIAITQDWTGATISVTTKDKA